VETGEIDMNRQKHANNVVRVSTAALLMLGIQSAKEK
jgi:hypothetical protein